MKSLKAQNSILADTHEQLEILEHGVTNDFVLVPFQQTEQIDSGEMVYLKTALKRCKC